MEHQLTEQIPLRLERQQNPVADRVSAVLAVVRPVLRGTLYALKRDRADRLGGYERVLLTDLAREYRAGDGDYGVCFEYAVHDAVRRGDPLVAHRVQDVLKRYCRIKDDRAESILFGAEKDGAQRLVSTAKELLTPDSILLTGSRGRPVKLRRHLDSIAREFRKRKGPSELPNSISGLWKADLFLGGPDSDRWVGTTVKVKAGALEGARGLRVGIVPVTDRGGKDKPYLDDHRNLVVLPLPYDGEFSEVFFSAWSTVKQFLNADAHVPKPAFLPNSADREVARQLEERRDHPVLDVIAALDVLAQPHLVQTTETSVDVVPYNRPDSMAASQHLDTDALLAPMSLEADN